VPHVQLWLGVTVTAGSAGGVLTAWAQHGRNGWVGDTSVPPGPKGVKVGMQSVRETSALCGEKDTTIGCDKGLPTVYPPMVGVCCAECSPFFLLLYSPAV